MTTYECDDFRVAFTRIGTDAYSLVTTAADGRQVHSSFTLPLTSGRLERAVIALSRGTREVPSAAEGTVVGNAQELGSELAAALFDEPLGAFFDDARRAAAAHGRGVRLTLSLASTPELLSVPWELLYRRPTFLASQRRTPIVRYLDVGDVPVPQQIDGQVRILGVVASPSGLPPLDVEGERARVESALAHMTALDLVTLDWCDPATPRSLRERLRDGSYHILHFIGHSDFTDQGEGVLYLVDERGGPAAVSDDVLTNLLGDQTSLRLAVLNSCEGARSTLTDPFAGIATSLVALGIPAVIAMQFAISDRAAIVFAEELFTSLVGRQYPIDAAVSEARKAVFTEVNEVEWATPVLFLRSDDGELFSFATTPTELPLKVAPTPIEDPATAEQTVSSDPGRKQPASAPGDSRWTRRVVVAAGAAAAVGLGVWLVVRPHPSPPVADASTTVLAGTPSCGNRPVPPRPGAPALVGDQLAAFQDIQEWADLLASARTGETNVGVFNTMSSLYPNQTGHFANPAGLSGFGNMEANHLIDPIVRSADPLTFDITSLVYDNESTSPCRTRLLCVHALYDDGVIQSYTWAGRQPQDFNHGWHTADEVADMLQVPISQLTQTQCDAS